MTSSPAAADQTGSAGELDRLCRTWDVGLAETLARLDHLVAQTEEALRLTQVLVARWRRTEPASG